MRRVIFPLVAAALLLSACGGGSGSISMKGPATGGGGATGGELSDQLCADFDDPDGPSDELIAALPDRFAPSVEAIEVFTATGEAEMSASALIDALSVAGLDENLRELSAYAEEQCGPTEGGAQIAAIADAAVIAREPKDDEYCDALAGFVDPESSEPPTADAIDAIRELAPESHAPAFDAFERMMTGATSEEESNGLLGLMLGLGAYAEGTCGVADALAQFAIAAAFAGMSDGTGGPGGTADVTTTTIDLTTSPADPAAANGAASAAGASVLFGPFPIQLEEDDPAYKVSAIVPASWELDDTFGVEFSPPAGSGESIFTSIRFDTGCDGLCAPTAWDERLRGDDGAIGQFLANYPAATERPVAGSAGVVLVSANPEDPAAKVIRWDDATPKYFVCTVDLDSAAAAMLDALTAACESSRPAWIAVS